MRYWMIHSWQDERMKNLVIALLMVSCAAGCRSAPDGDSRIPQAAVTRIGVAPPRPPSAELVCNWVKFSKPVTLRREQDDYEELRTVVGKVIWSYTYSSLTQAKSSYTIALYKGESLFGDKRTEVENQLQELEDLAEELGKQPPIGPVVETRDDGRKVYFFIAALGPGGAAMAGFTGIRNGEYDLLVMEYGGDEHGEPTDERASATNSLSEIFRMVEAYLEQQMWRTSASSGLAADARNVSCTGTADERRRQN